VARALAIGRTRALTAANTNRAVGSAYNRAMGAWLQANGLADVNAQERYRALQVLDNLKAIEVWRAGLPDAVCRKLNHPSRVLRRFTATTKGFTDDTACRHAPSREWAIFPPAVKERARRRIMKVLELYGPDACKLAEAALAGALPHVQDV